MDLSRNKYSFGYLPDTKKYAESKKREEKKQLEKLDLSKIIQVDFPDDQYYKHQTKKTQIVLHHTVSGEGVNGDINWWRKTTSRIATAIIIGHNGDIYQCFSTKFWGHHLGVKSDFINERRTNKTNLYLNKHSIGIEIDSWGGLVEYRNKWYPAKWDINKKKMIANTKLGAVKDVQTYSQPFRGFYGFERYTNNQIEAVRKLLVFWNERYNIPLNYNPEMWNVSNHALNGEPGIWSHVSYRDDKSDCHPQPELIHMLRSL
ncbi:MAG: N-acetylmuramoyl-L-alanine amidase [bacterium]